MTDYCPLCCKVVAPFDREAVIHQNKRTHGPCLARLKLLFPSVMEQEQKPGVVFRTVKPATYDPLLHPPSPLQSMFVEKK